MKTLILVFFILVIGIGLPLAILLIRDRIYDARRRRHEPLERAEWKRRMSEPKLADLERHFGKPLPRSFRRLHENRELVNRSGFFIAPPGREPADCWEIHWFEPADLQTVTRTWGGLADSHLPFASDVFGDLYYLVLDSATPDDAPVYHYAHDGDDHEAVASSLDEFLGWPTLTREEWEARIDEAEVRAERGKP